MMQQNKDEIVEFLKKLWLEKGNGLIISLSKKGMRDYLGFVQEQTSFLDQHRSDCKYSNAERLWFLFNNATQFPKCANCGKLLDDPKNFLSLSEGFRQYCCLHCATSSKLRAEHIKETTFKNSGYTSNFSNPAKIQQIKATNESKSKEEKEARLSKIRETRESRNGGKWHSNDFGAKCKKTLLQNHGSENWHNLEKMRQSLLEKYGVSCAFNIPDVQKKSALAIKMKSFDEYIANSAYDSPMFSIDDYCKEHSLQHEFEFKCKKCGNIFKSVHRDGMHKRCPACYPKLDGTSHEEKEMINFIQSISKENVKTNCRSLISPMEIDIAIESRKLAFEFDGLYWHSDEQQCDSNYHLHKTNLCENIGYQLVHVFEDEWIYKKEIVKSRIKNLLGIYDEVVFARKCEVREVDSAVSKKFQEENHIQGAVNAKVNLGLFYDDELVSLMTFGKPRFSKKHEWELLRFCNKLGYHVPGAAGKLLKYFERNYSPKNLISYADRRWSQGKLYKALGFQLDSISKPDYWYIVEFQKRQSRVKFQKHKLKKLLEKFDESLSEVANMRANGYFRIFDCGNYVFVKNY